MSETGSTLASGYQLKKYEDLTIADDFMFCKIMTTYPELCKHLLEIILNVEIKEIRFPEQQKTISMTADAKSVRLDVYVNDDNHTVYDIEMQTTENPNLPQRSRYYQSMIDLNTLEKGADYLELPNSFVIFICTFDCFGRGLPVYTFCNQCEENHKLKLNDGTKKIFLNPDSNRKNLSPDLNAFLNYLQGQLTKNSFIETLDASVKDARKHEKWRLEYMTIEIRDQDKLREGEQIGERNQSIKIAMAMFQDGLPLETVQKYTKILSTKE
ncbi:MAG: Rpn family recombination-promoting nuclease/putative transposase, partial [Lachnospiraceae bacterium]